MTEQRGDSAIDVLRSRLGPRHQAGIDEGRADIERVLRDEMNIDRDQAAAMVQRMIDEGTLRYVTSDERDPEVGLRREVVMEARLLDAELLRNVGVAERVEAAHLHQTLRDVEDSLRGSRAPFDRHPPSFPVANLPTRW